MGNGTNFYTTDSLTKTNCPRRRPDFLNGRRIENDGKRRRRDGWTAGRRKDGRVGDCGGRRRDQEMRRRVLSSGCPVVPLPTAEVSACPAPPPTPPTTTPTAKADGGLIGQYASSDRSHHRPRLLSSNGGFSGRPSLSTPPAAVSSAARTGNVARIPSLKDADYRRKRRTLKCRSSMTIRYLTPFAPLSKQLLAS
uniref:Uncharacterized protein n=1 Tax=Plectus sambesii TaxID=2011161 RepID=A0A914W1X6_9BILA